MRLRHIPGAEETIAASPYVVQDPQAQKGRWDQLFGNTNPIEIEVGMGKGRFIMELAQKNPGDQLHRHRALFQRAAAGPSKEGRAGAGQYLFYVH